MHKGKRQYTIRNIPPALDLALRERARAEDKSLNDVVIDALARGAGIGAEQLRYRDLADLAGTWMEDSDFDQAIADQDTIEPGLWK